jgi:hypothetical protein
VQRLTQSGERRADGRFAGPFVRLEPPRRFRHRAEQRDRKDHPPDGDGQERQAYWQRCLRRRQALAGGQAERAGRHDPGQVQRQQDTAAQVAQRVAGGGDAVHLVVARDVRQQRLVEDEAAHEADVGQHEQQDAQQPVAVADEEHGGHGAGAQCQEACEQPLLVAAIV